MGQKRKISVEGARAALYLLEADPTLRLEDICQRIGISRTQLRANLKRLASVIGDEETNLTERVNRVLNERTGRTYVLSDSELELFKKVRGKIPKLKHDEAAKIFGVSSATLYRALHRVDSGAAWSSEKFDQARQVLPIATETIENLQIPNDLSEEHRDLFLELSQKIRFLNSIVYALLEDHISDQTSEALDVQNEIESALPLFRKAWEVFVLKSADTAGATFGKGAVFTAGFVAGSLANMFG